MVATNARRRQEAWQAAWKRASTRRRGQSSLHRWSREALGRAGDDEAGDEDRKEKIGSRPRQGQRHGWMDGWEDGDEIRGGPSPVPVGSMRVLELERVEVSASK